MAAALALVLIVPSGVMAAGKLYRYFTTSIQKDKYSVTAEMNQTKGKKNEVYKSFSGLWRKLSQDRKK